MFGKIFRSISAAAKTGSQMANAQTILLRNYRVALEKTTLMIFKQSANASVTLVALTNWLLYIC